MFHFRCSKCGAELDFVVDVEESKKLERGIVLKIIPCPNCTEEF